MKFCCAGRLEIVAGKESGKSPKTILSKTGVRDIQREIRKKYEGRRELCFLLQDWDDGYNVGGMFRLADGCGASELILTGKTPQPEANPMIGVTSMGQHRRIKWRHFARHDEACQKLIDEGWTLIALEIAEGAVEFTEFDFPQRTCIVVGNEGAGVFGGVMKFCSAAVYIPMFGKGRSLNVVSSASVVGYAVVLGDR